jgi:hypothetical protein
VQGTGGTLGDLLARQPDLDIDLGLTVAAAALGGAALATLPIRLAFDEDGASQRGLLRRRLF